MNKLRDLLNCIIWNPSEKEKDKFLISYRDGKAEKEIRVNGIVKVDGFGFTALDGSYIPFHRIRAVRKENETVWRKSPP